MTISKCVNSREDSNRNRNHDENHCESAFDISMQTHDIQTEICVSFDQLFITLSQALISHLFVNVLGNEYCLDQAA